MSEKLDNIIEQLKSLTLLEASELVAEIEKIFCVDTSASVANVAISTTDDNSEGSATEQTEFEIILSEVPADKKIAILKIIRNFTGLGLKDSKEIVDNIPRSLKEGVTKQEAEDLQKEIETVGGKLTIK
jgi:large subunit ribosomal protein L7/L12